MSKHIGYSSDFNQDVELITALIEKKLSEKNATLNLHTNGKQEVQEAKRMMPKVKEIIKNTDITYKLDEDRNPVERRERGGELIHG